MSVDRFLTKCMSVDACFFVRIVVLRALFCPQGSANEYSFDAVFPPEAGQSEVYQGTAKPHISELLEGINVTVFAYGATGQLFQSEVENLTQMYRHCSTLVEMTIIIILLSV